MRIAFVAAGYPPDLGGVELVISELACRMVLAGHEVEVLAHESLLAPPGSEHREGVLVRRFRVPLPSKDFAVSPAILAELARRHHDFDVVHAHNYHTLPPLGAALAGMRPLVFSPHYHGGAHSRAARVAYGVYRPISRLLFRACAHIVCGSAAEADALIKDFPGITAPVTVVSHGVDVTAFAGAQPFEVAAKVAIAAGRMEPYKQFDRVALAAETLPEDTEVILLGDGPARPDLERLIACRGLGRRVRCLGRVSDEDLRRWFRTAKVLVSMSRQESFGLTLIEALAAGIPVVASDIPAHREIAESHSPGTVRLVSVNASPTEIADAIVSASSGGFPAGARFKSWDDAVGQVLGIYESVLARTNHRVVSLARTSKSTASTWEV
jgi:glycosyltransferase involved in cell wall biosynthesis